MPFSALLSDTSSAFGHATGSHAAHVDADEQHPTLLEQDDCGIKHACLEGPVHEEDGGGMPGDGDGGAADSCYGADEVAPIMTADLATDGLCNAVGQAASEYIEKVCAH